MKKRLIALILAVLMVLLCGCGAEESAAAVPAADGESTGTEDAAVMPAEEVFPEEAPQAEVIPVAADGVSGLCGDNVFWSFADGVLTLSGEGPTEDFDFFAAPWDVAEVSLLVEKAVVEEGITALGSNAFGACPNMKEISLPSTLTGIGGFAFSDCSALEELAFPDGLLYIGESAFSGSGLKLATLPADLPVLGDRAFALCNNLEEITLPAQLILAGEDLFDGSEALTSVYLCDGNEVGAGAPWEELIVRSGAPARDRVKWAGVTGNAKWSVDSSDLVLCVEGEGAVLDYAPEGTGAAPWLCLAKVLKGARFSDGITELGDYALWGCTALESVTLPNGLLRIGDYALGACSALTELSLPASLKEIGDGAFSCCSALTVLTVPEGVEYIGAGCFSLCYELMQLHLPSSLTDAGENAFDLPEGAEITAPAGSFAEQFAREGAPKAEE